MEKINNDPKLITILVIDDDAICLSILGGALTKVEYHVVAVANPLDALDVLSTRSNEFDLILTDVHMPEMSGIELLKHVENYNLPVVLMSADQNNNMILKGLQDGAVFFFVKPISIYNLSKLRQFAISSTKGTTNRHDNPISPIYMSRIIASKPSFQEQQRMMHNNTTNNDIVVMHNYESNSNGQNKENYIPLVYSNNNALKRPSSSNETGLKDKSNKKQKLVWTTSLHNKFLDAVNSLGVDKAVPKRILERMNVPGLRRENVASHLQKYRMFLNKVTEATTANEDGVPNNWNERPFRSSFVLNEITFLTGQLQQCQEYIAEQSLGLTNNPSTYEIGESSAQGASRGGVVRGDLVQNYPSEEVVRNLNRSVELLEKLQRLQAMHQQVPPSLNVDQQGLSSMDGRVLGNQFQSTNNNNNNYVGLRLSTNGELIGINNTPLAHGDFVASDNNLANGINGSNHTENNVGAQEVNYEMNFANNSIHNNNYNNNAPLVDNFSGIIDDWGFYTPNVDQNAMPQEDPFGMLQGMPNLQGIGDELRELGIDISADQENIGNNNIVNNFDFGSFDAQGNAEGDLFDGFDQGITGNGDISFENYFAQNIEQEFNQQEGGADDVTKFND